MSIMIDMPPQMVQEARAYASDCGMTIEKLLLNRLRADIDRKRAARTRMERLDALARKATARLSGKAYVFNRADAYEPEVAFA